MAFGRKNFTDGRIPLLLTSTAILIYMKIDQVMLKGLVGTETVGTYAAAVKFCEVWYHIPVLIAVSLCPAIIGVKDKDPALYHAQLQKLYTLLVWVALVLATPITFLADWIIYILYGNEYFESVIILKIYVRAGIFVSMSLANNKWMVFENFQNYILLTTLLGMSSNIIFNVILIPSYRAPGAAVATLISCGIGSYAGLAFFKKSRQAFWMTTLSFNPFGVYKRNFQYPLVHG